MKLGASLTKLMNDRDITPTQLAKRANVSKGYMWQLLHEDKSPGVEILDRIARVLGVTIDDILHPEQQQLRKPDKHYVAYCTRCHSTNALSLIPHGAEGETNGWIFACSRCAGWLLGANVAVTYRRPKRIPEGEDG